MDLISTGLDAILGTGLGFVARLAPEIIKLFTAKGDRDHEFRMQQLAAQQQQAGYDARRADGRLEVEKLDLQALITATQAQARRTGIKIIDALSASVRPVTTYWWMALYTAVKAASLFIAVGQQGVTATAIHGCWDAWDQTVLASILAYWFMDRSLRRQQGAPS